MFTVDDRGRYSDGRAHDYLGYGSYKDLKVNGTNPVTQKYQGKEFEALSGRCSEPKSNDAAQSSSMRKKSSEPRQVFDVDSTSIRKPYFRLDVELSSHPIFSFLVYNNGEARFVYLRQRNPSVDSLFAAGDDKKRLMQLKYETSIQRARFDSAEFKSLRSIVFANSSLLQRNTKGEEDGARFIMDFYSHESAPVACSWQEPLSKRQAAFVKGFFDLAFREFPNDTAQMLREAVFDNAPSLNQVE